MPVITKPEDKFEIGKAILMREGKDVSIFACGVMVYEALQAAEILEKEGISAEIVNFHTPKPIDADAVVKSARKTGAVVSAEEHTIKGGLGGAIAEVLSQNHPTPLKMVGINDRFGESGSPPELMKAFGLTAEDLAKAAKEVIKKKQK
jgi:transketolase